MCGICGVASKTRLPSTVEEQLMRMHQTQLHRGPDDSGFYIKGPVALASQRLAILDLSSAGHMPMSSEDGRFWMVYNGEVYNFSELREELEKTGSHFNTGTDTEVILEMYRQFGASMLSRFNGMFAFAIWDEQEQTLFIARDRCGVKPLVYAHHGNSFLFASEEKALIAGGVQAEFDEDTWEEILYFRYVSGERTPYKNIRRLLPGHYMVWKDGALDIRCWWSPEEMVNGQPSAFSFREAEEKLGQLLEDTVRLRRISDVPVGILLSGGLDSSALAATAANQTNRISSFTVRFKEAKYDEGEYARLVAKFCQLDAHELTVAESDVPMLIEEATRLLDAPLVHVNDIHLLAISKFAKPLVTVLLSGEGADEIFGGYVRYRLFQYPKLLNWLGKLSGNIPSLPDPSGRFKKSVKLLRYKRLGNMQLFSSADVHPFEIGSEADFTKLDYRRQSLERSKQVYKEPLRQVLLYEQQTYLQSVLDRNDRMTMGASIECREPFLDPRIMEWAANLPTSILAASGLRKMVLRSVMKNKLPQRVLAHPKWGFATPLQSYFRNIPSLRDYLQRIPDSPFVQSSPLKKEMLKSTVQTFLQGNDEQLPLVRQLMMASIWHDTCIEGKREIFHREKREAVIAAYPVS